MTKERAFVHIQNHNFPSAQYVVFGSVAMAAQCKYTCRELGDVDVLVTRMLFDECDRNRKIWEPKEHPLALRDDHFSGMVEIYCDGTERMPPFIEFSGLRDTAHIISGIPFCNLKDLIAIKKYALDTFKLSSERRSTYERDIVFMRGFC